MNIIQNFPKYSGVALKVPFQHLFEKTPTVIKEVKDAMKYPHTF